MIFGIYKECTGLCCVADSKLVPQSPPWGYSIMTTFDHCFFHYGKICKVATKWCSGCCNDCFACKQQHNKTMPPGCLFPRKPMNFSRRKLSKSQEIILIWSKIMQKFDIFCVYSTVQVSWSGNVLHSTKTGNLANSKPRKNKSDKSQEQAKQGANFRKNVFLFMGEG